MISDIMQTFLIHCGQKAVRLLGFRRLQGRAAGYQGTTDTGHPYIYGECYALCFVWFRSLTIVVTFF